MQPSEAAMWEALVSWFVPVIVAWINDDKWSGPIKVGVTVLVCIVVGLVTAIFTGGLSSVRLGTAILITLFGAMVTYKRFWQPVGLVNRNT